MCVGVLNIKQLDKGSYKCETTFTNRDELEQHVHHFQGI